MKAHSLQTFVRSIMPFLSKGEGPSTLDQVQPASSPMSNNSARAHVSSAPDMKSSSLFRTNVMPTDEGSSSLAIDKGLS